MYLHWKEGVITLDAPGDFKSFNILIEGGDAGHVDVQTAFAGIADFDDVRNAWVSQDVLRAWPSQKGDAQWQRDLEAMIAKARPYGWLHEVSGAIKAHVEWVAERADGDCAQTRTNPNPRIENIMNARSVSTPVVETDKPAMTEFSSVDFRRCLGEFVTGVTVITTVGLDGQRYGLTANSFSSLSLDPPLILWSLRLNATNFGIYSTAETFAVNILAEDQVDVSNRFAESGPDRFDGISVTPGTGGLPLIDGSVAQIECKREATYPGGDHVVFIGRVQRIRNTGRKPLAIRSGKYMTVHPHELVPTSGDIALGNIATLNAMHAGRLVLEDLWRETDKTVGLSVWGNLGPTVVWWCESSRPLHTQLRFGLVMSLLNSSAGIVFAAYAPREVTARLLEAELAQQASGDAQRFKTRAELEAYLAQVRADKLGSIINVVNPGPNKRGISAFSAPVFDAQGEIVMTFAIMDDGENFHAEDPAIERLRSAAAKLSARFGYRDDAHRTPSVGAT